MITEEWISKLKQLHDKLESLGIPARWYRLHGLFGSTDEEDKLSLEIKRGKYIIEYEVYYTERGEKHSIRTFFDLDEACSFLHDKLIVQQRIFHE